MHVRPAENPGIPGESVRPSWLTRDHLLDLLDRSAPGSLTLLVAPAGYGKTTLLAQHLERFRGEVVRWRPSRGTTGAAALLSAVHRELGGAGEPATVARLLQRVERRPEQVLLVVDDLHLIHGAEAESVLEEIALLAPPNLRLLLAGQRLPLFNLTRWELAASTVLGPADLRLRADEVGRLLHEVYGSRLSGRRVAEVEALTQGWPAALRLLHPALLHPTATGAAPPLATVVGSLTRTYLEREVLRPLPERLVRFLEQVSPLPRLDAARCDALVGGSDSAWTLDVLADERGLLRREHSDCSFHWGPLLRDHLLHRRSARTGGDGRERARLRPETPATAPAPVRALPAAPEPWSLRCFGCFELTLGERELDWTTIRPRARALLRMLAIHPGQPVHRELLTEALWPERPPETAARCLHVAVSALRRFLEPGITRGGSQLLVRSGEAYLLRLPPDGSCDLRRFETALAEGLRAETAGRPDAAARALRSALEAYTGELLPEDGPAEWVVDRREHYQRAAAEAALVLARLELARDRPLGGAQAAARSVQIDPFRDDAWQTLIAAHERSGDTAAAERSRKGHARMLLSLGLPAADADAAAVPAARGHGRSKNSTSAMATRRSGPAP
ncbi:BTAD domain-containing putative transcriptional regulator [Kitasatospora sp. NPDC094028]